MQKKLLVLSLSILILACIFNCGCITEEKKENDGSDDKNKVTKPLSIRIETDKDIYNIGEYVNVTAIMVNENKSISFSVTGYVWGFSIYASNGTLIWSTPLKGYISVAPTVKEGKVYVGCENPDQMVCLNASTGKTVYLLSA